MRSCSLFKLQFCKYKNKVYILAISNIRLR